MNYLIQNTSKYSGQTSITTLLALITHLKQNCDTFIITTEFLRYCDFFSEFDRFFKTKGIDGIKSNLVRQNQVDAWRDAVGENLKQHSIMVSDGVYIVPLISGDGLSKECCKAIVRKLFKLQIPAFYDIDASFLTQDSFKRMNNKLLVYEPYALKRAKAAEEIKKLKLMNNADFVTMVCNRSTRDGVRVTNEHTKLKVRQNQVIYVPEIYDLRNWLLSKKIDTLVARVIAKDPNFQEYVQPFDTLYKMAVGKVG